ncbi:MAG: TetR/AcrR family transcriptional regulator [Candidatus Phaeomarinobacter sp.]
MSTTTRPDLLQAALTLFAERGFYGASIAEISRELGLTKQALLHHFGTKEKLYGDVLQLINDQMLEQMEALQTRPSPPEHHLEETIVALYGPGPEATLGARVIMRELLDNVSRAEQARSWYLKPFLEKLIDMARQVPGHHSRSDGELLAVVYQLLGAVNYFSLSQPTLLQIFGKKTLTETKKAFPDELRKLIRGALG